MAERLIVNSLTKELSGTMSSYSKKVAARENNTMQQTLLGIFRIEN